MPWSGWTDGRIVHHGGESPFGFLPDELEAAITKELGPAEADE